MVIVRYNNPLLNHWIYRVYLKNGSVFVAHTYNELLNIIATYRL